MKYRVFKNFIFLLVLLAGLSEAAADSRYALLVGANRGSSPGQVPLLYAGQDAERMADVLINLGGFSIENIIVSKNPSANKLRGLLAKLNARIRSESSAVGDSFLFVYYSGHADSISLHLGGTLLPWEELRNWTASSHARARLLVIDACQSGHATRVKGTRLEQPFALPTKNIAIPEGFAILSSATAGENSLESDQIRGSFFTHHFIAGLKGVADVDGDRVVTLNEAYRYTAKRTVASTISTLSGVQHPTYLYELKGKKDLILTRLHTREELSALSLSKRGQYFFYRNSLEGVLELEANIAAENRTVYIPAGKYFVRHRTLERFYEGKIELQANSTTELNTDNLNRIEYAQLVRKGGVATRVYSLSLWGGMAPSLLEGYRSIWNQALGFSINTRLLTLEILGRFSYHQTENLGLKGMLKEYGLLAGIRKVFDFNHFSLSTGARVGASYLDQKFESNGDNPGRWSLVPVLEVMLRGERQLPAGFFLGLEGSARVINLRVEGDQPDSERKTPLQFIGAVGIGKYW